MANLFHVLLLIATFSPFSLTSTIKNPWLPLNYHTAFMQAKTGPMVALDTAAKLDPHPHLLSPYSVSLYHRDMLQKSEFTDSDSLLEARIARDISRSRYLASLFGSSKINSEKVEPNEIVKASIYASGEYVVTFWVGSNLEVNHLLLDLGSPLVWWQCWPYEPNKCYEQNADNPKYKSTTSTSFQEIDCTGETSSCLLPDYVTTCSQQSHRCLYEIGYGSGQVSKGYMAHETLIFPISLTSTRIEFGCGKDQTNGSNFDGNFGGIAGLGGGLYPQGLGRYSLPTQLNAPVFSFCLPGPTSRSPSTLYFNASWSVLYDNGVKASLIRDDNNESFYYVQLFRIRIGGTYDVEVQRSPTWDGRIFVDSGSSYTYLPRDVYYNMRRIVKYDWLTYKMPVDDPENPFDLCYDKDEVSVSEFPSVLLYFNNSDYGSLLLPKKQVVIEIHGRNCLSFLPAEGPYAYIGNNHLYGTALTFDLSAMTLTFNQDVCVE